MSQHRSTGRRGLFRVLGAAALVCAALVAPAIAHADTRTAQVTLANPLVTPNLPFQTGFGVYNFTVSNVLPNETFPFASGIKFGHCVDLTHDAGSSAVTLETSPDFTGTVAANPGRIQWLLESSRLKSPTSAEQAAAHQSAIWQVTNPGDPGGLLTTSAARRSPRSSSPTRSPMRATRPRARASTSRVAPTPRAAPVPRARSS